MADKEQPKKCVKCHHVGDEKDQFCIKCGSPLINRCGDTGGKRHKGCSFVNREDAAFCAKCGYPTVFNQHGLVTSSTSQTVSNPSLGKINFR